MGEIVSVYQKIQNCRDGIKASNLTKAGNNSYSNYDYYTPEQVDALVNGVCKTENLFHKFQLKRDENGIYGEMTIIDLETNSEAVFVMATEMPVMTATNATQQMGVAITYTNRYMLMFVFDIVENSLDPDAQKPAKKPQGNKNKSDDLPWLNPDMKEFEQARNAIFTGKRTLEDVMKKFKVSKANQEVLSGKTPALDDTGNLPIDPYVQDL